MAENLGVKNAAWDKQDGLFVPRDCYNSYMYVVEDENSTPIDKFILHGEDYMKNFDGGAALHLNLDHHLDKEQYLKLMNVATKTGCNYWTINVRNTLCNDCGYISKNDIEECPHCHSKNIDHLTRVIGYLKKVSSFSSARQEEESKRFYQD